MKTINFKLVRTGYLTPILYVDDKLVKLKTLGNGSWSASFSTEKPAVDIKITTMYELSGKNGLLKALLLWAVGFFGFFSPGYPKKCPAISYEAKNIKLSEKNNLICKFLPFRENEPAIEFDSDELSMLDNKTNVYLYDKTAQKKRKIFLGLSWGLRLAGVIAAIILVFAL